MERPITVGKEKPESGIVAGAVVGEVVIFLVGVRVAEMVATGVGEDEGEGETEGVRVVLMVGVGEPAWAKSPVGVGLNMADVGEKVGIGEGIEVGIWASGSTSGVVGVTLLFFDWKIFVAVKIAMPARQSVATETKIIVNLPLIFSFIAFSAAFLEKRRGG